MNVLGKLYIKTILQTYYVSHKEVLLIQIQFQSITDTAKSDNF